MTDMDIYVSIAAGLEESGWSAVLSTLDKETFAKITAALDSVKDVSEVQEEELKEDPVDAIQQLNGKMTKIMKALKAHRKRFQRLDNRLQAIEAGGGGGDQSYEDAISVPSVKKVVRKKKLKSMKVPKRSAEDDIKQDSGTSARKHFYRFGYRNVQVVKPSQGYPIPKEAKRPVEGKLTLFFSHGYSGNFDESRQNVCLSPDGNKLLYYIAAVCVVFEFKKMKQRFFTRHNDDLTTLCICPFGKPWAATGQKDPKDTPGQGKDLPKIWIWNYKTMKPVQLIDNVCWGKIARLQWSASSTYLYCICGDPEQTLKAYDPEQFKGKGKPDEMCKCNTMKEAILGFEINPRPNKAFVDEFIMYGKRKFTFIAISKGKKGLTVKIKAVSITALKKDGEKSFGCCAWLPDGRYVVGAKSGAMYIGRASQALAIVGNAHGKSVGCIIYDGEALLSAGHDRFLKRWAIGSSSGGFASNSGGSSDEAPASGKGKKKKGKKKKTPRAGGSPGGALLTETWSHLVDIPESDFILQPKAMAFDAKSMCLFVGTKTNQIMKFEMKSEDAQVVVDGHDGQIWGLATHPEEALFVTGGYDNAVKVWDATTSKCIRTHEFEIAQGDKGKQISCAAWSNDGSIMVFGTEDSCIAVFSWPDFTFQRMIEIPPKSKNAEVEPVSYLRFSEDSSLLGAAHMDSNLYIFSVNGNGTSKIVLQRWDGLPHVAAPTNVQFDMKGRIVKTLTRDYEIVHWLLNADSHQGKFLPRIPDPDVVEWADDPLIAGWDVQGLYQRGWDGTDLNDATLTSDSKLIVSGDDYGTIRLHNYPAVAQEACIAYSGHAEFVVGVEFLRDDSQLISCGGNDMAIFQWRLNKNYK